MAGKNTLTATDVNFEQLVLQSDVPVLVDFTASWCGPCKQIAPLVDQLADEYEGKAKVTKLDIDENPGIASRFGIRGVPTLLMFKGGELVGQRVGAAPKSAIAELINKAL